MKFLSLTISLFQDQEITRNSIAMTTNNKTFYLSERCSYAGKLTNKTNCQLFESLSVARKLTNKTFKGFVDYTVVRTAIIIILRTPGVNGMALETNLKLLKRL